MRIRPVVCLALVAAAVTFVPSSDADPHGAHGPTKAEGGVVAGLATAPPQAAGPTSDESRMVISGLVRWVATAKAELAQYQLGLHVACASGDATACWRAMHYSATIGADIAADLNRVSGRPPEVAALWSRTHSTAVAMQWVAAGSCGPSRELNGCAAQVQATVIRMTRVLSDWDPYVAMH
jgi:hypothetical protein